MVSNLIKVDILFGIEYVRHMCIIITHHYHCFLLMFYAYLRLHVDYLQYECVQGAGVKYVL